LAPAPHHAVGGCRRPPAAAAVVIVVVVVVATVTITVTITVAVVVAVAVIVVPLSSPLMLLMPSHLVDCCLCVTAVIFVSTAAVTAHRHHHFSSGVHA